MRWIIGQRQFFFDERSKEIFSIPGQGRDFASAPGPDSKKFFGSFFQKRTA
jgi:hypothetical protein